MKYPKFQHLAPNLKILEAVSGPPCVQRRDIFYSIEASALRNKRRALCLKLSTLNNGQGPEREGILFTYVPSTALLPFASLLLAIILLLLLPVAFITLYICLPFKKFLSGAPGWRSGLSVRLQPGHDLAVCEFEPRIRLWADGSEPGACF